MESFVQLLDAVKNYCRQYVSETAYDVWLKEIEPVSFSGDSVTISAPSDFKRETIEKRYMNLLSEAFENVIGYQIPITIVSREAENPVKLPETNTASSEKSNSAYTFDNYIIGPDNRFAHAAAQAVAANPSNAYNPLFIYGASGLGKTHLLFAIKNMLEKTRPELRVLYIGGDSFTNELISAITAGSTAPFHEKYRNNIDVLLVDDVQFIAGKESTQEEFFHTFNALHEAKKQIVLTSDRPPKEIKSLEDRLRTRFEWGLLADVKPPDYETRVSILYKKAEAINFTLSTEVADYIAKHLKSDIRQLEGAVNKLYAYYLIDGTKPSIASAQEAIQDTINEQVPWPATVDKIINEVGRFLNVSPEDIRSNKQNSAISNARQISMYIIREVTGNTMEKIGTVFGKNHATVVYAISKVEKMIKTDIKTKDMVDDIIKNCS